MAPLGSLAAVTLLAVGVIGGNPLWESGVRLQAPRPVQRIAIDSSGHAMVEAKNGSHSNAVALGKRWVIPHHNAASPWPDRTISYCYATPEARAELNDYFVRAQRAWENAGLATNDWKYKETATPGKDCTDHPDRASTLVIYQHETALLSTIGLQRTHPDRPDYLGPRMVLSTREDIGALDITTNVAHELGHVWGLQHEHQNKWFWEKPVGESSQAHIPFQVANFNCHNLKDYEEAVASLKGTDTKEMLCTDQNVANKYRFSARDWLPFSANYLYEISGTPIEDDPDWESLMLYPGTAGGAGTASPAPPPG